VSGVPGLFNIRDRAEHTRKRKILSHAFSLGAINSFEVHMTENLRRWVSQLDRIASRPDCDGYAGMNILPWCIYIAFDIMGDLSFGAPFGMVAKGKDECEAQLVKDGPIILAPGAETLDRRGEVSATLGLLLPLRPYARYLPDSFFSKGLQSVRDLHGIAEAAISKRLSEAEQDGAQFKQRNDVLGLLVRGKDANGDPMGHDELVSEALTQMVAGSDTVSNTACAVFYWILHGERAAPGSVIPRLQAELDAAILPGSEVAAHSQVRYLPFLGNCINEAMRIHSTNALGLPRIVTSELGVQFDQYHFARGSVLSVPSYTIHHDSEVWGPDVEEFRPDRWLPKNLTARQKTCFNPFSLGPRSCIGQNVVRMELSLIIGTAFRRYEFRLYQEKLESQEGFSKKPVECYLGIKRRA